MGLLRKRTASLPNRPTYSTVESNSQPAPSSNLPHVGRMRVSPSSFYLVSGFASLYFQQQPLHVSSQWLRLFLVSWVSPLWCFFLFPLGIRPFPCILALVSLCSLSFALPLRCNTKCSHEFSSVRRTLGIRSNSQMGNFPTQNCIATTQQNGEHVSPPQTSNTAG